MVVTKKLSRYFIKFGVRICIFLFVLGLYLYKKEYMLEFISVPFINRKLSPLYAIWAVYMVTMILHIFPSKLKSMALLKSKEEKFVPVENYSELGLLKYVQDQNRKAWIVMLVWLSFNAFWGLLYLFGIIGVPELVLLSAFYFLCDYICILVFCPFQTKIMHNKCCINCRIYDWGHFMMFTPMLFIKNFFCWSLFFTSLIVLIKWEIIYSSYPERFWSGSNQILKCANCQEKTCQLKRKVTNNPLENDLTA